ncbi:glutathione S-transferase family protein [Flavimaricola marinus]|uniref:Glutathione S-transferase GstB n=1 Tax=Flavimaricola marinus TaxID=1819565 RepID=A0A238LF57_9RHOB|nr:glutathione S-transferase family protein [Flavimaricola marinus]SMY08055.1 Glutathione S-transferase GstB [Flavimaricola marinus]
MILWGRASSVNVQKVLWALDEFGATYEHRIVGGKYGGFDDPDFAKLSPIKRIPVLEDGGLGVWESHAVLRHLARRLPDHPLGRSYADFTQAAQIDSWLDFVTSTLQPPFIGLFWQLVRMTEAQRNLALVEAHLAALTEGLTVLETVLADGRDHLVGSDLSIADIGVATMLYRLFDVAPQLSQTAPKVSAWHAKMAARPAYARHVAVGYDELRPA